MTLLDAREKTAHTPPSFFRKLRIYFVAAAVSGFIGYVIGYHFHSGLEAVILTLPKAALVTLGCGCLGCWIPLAIDYEKDPMWRLYIGAYFLVESLLLALIGYSIAASNA